ncbi:MAG: protein kinase [Planctomycetes bacterium]|nr:protein kinase [Planctomycetota bacterium]
MSSPEIPAVLPDRLGEFRILREIGKGAMGVVYEAIQESLSRRVALKVLSASLATDEEAVRRFRREAEAAAALHHPNLVTVHGAGESEGLHWLAMEFVEGETLAAWIEREPGGLSVLAVVKIGRQVAEGLQAAHETGILHRDIKPSNLMIRRGGSRVPDAPCAPSGRGDATVVLGLEAEVPVDDDFSVVVTDFGLAKPRADATLTASGVILGTPMYMSPEQVRGETLDGRSDVYSLGMVLHEAVTGSHPFAREDYHQILRLVLLEEPPRPRLLRSSIPRALEAVIQKAIEKDAGRRYASARELALDLARIEAGEPVLARSAGVWTRLARRAARHRIASGLVALATLAGLAAGTWALVAKRRAEESEAYVQAERLEDEARDLAAAGRTSEAIERYKDAAALAPQDARIWREMGILQLSLEKIDDATLSLERAVDLDPGDSEAWFDLAGARVRGRRWEAARDAADEAIRLAPEDPGRYRLRAEVRSQLGDSTGCLADHQAAAAIEAKARDRELALVDRSLADEDAGEALRRLAALPRTDGERPEVRLRRGLALRLLAERFDDSLRATLHSIDVDLPPGNDPARGALVARAEEDLARAWDGGVRDPRLPEALAGLALKRRDVGGAIAIWDRILDERPDDLAALRGTSRILFGSMRWKEALPVLDRLLALAPGDAEARYCRGIVRLIPPWGSTDPSLAWSDPDLSISRQLAVTHLAERIPLPAGEREIVLAALEDLEQAIAAGHQRDSARFCRALALARLDRRAEAREEIERLAAENPADATLAAARAAMDLGEGRLDEAERIARAAAGANEDSFAAWLVLGNILSSKGDQEGSLAAFSEAQRRIMAKIARDERFVAGLFGTGSRPRGDAPGRFGITLADLADDYARFKSEDLSPFLDALGDEDEGVQRKVQARLWAAGPGALDNLNELAAGGGRAGERARALFEEIETAIRSEEDSVARGAIQKYVRAYLAGDLEGVNRAILEMRAAREELAPVLVRLVLADLATDSRSAVLGSIGAVLGEDSPAAAISILAQASRGKLPKVLAELGPLLLHLTEPPPDSLRSLLSDPDPEVRALATLYLAPVLGRELEENALAGLGSGGEHRGLYARALVAMESRRAAPELLGLLAREAPEDGRAELVAALSTLGDASALEALRKLASDPAESLDTRLHAVQGLGRIGEKADVEFLVALLQAEDLELAGAAAWALGRIGEPESIEPLLRNAGRTASGTGIRLDAEFLDPSLAPAVALRAMGVSESAVLDRLRSALQAPSLTFLLPASDLFELGDPLLADSILDAAKADPGLPRLFLLSLLVPAAREDQVPELVSLLERAGWSERATLVEILGELGDPRAVPALSRILSETPPGLERVEVAWAISRSGASDFELPAEARRWTRARAGSLHAAELLARAGDPEALSILRRILSGEASYRVDAIMGTAVIQDREPASLRLQAARALALSGDREGLLALVPFLASRDPIDRRYAARTLEKIAGRRVEYDPLSPRPALEEGRSAWERALR